MKKTYFTPIAKTIDLSTESPLLADSLTLGENPVEDDPNNNFSNRRTIWDNTEW